ncbi:unnamed protein product, partial [Linum tenue]
MVHIDMYSQPWRTYPYETTIDYLDWFVAHSHCRVLRDDGDADRLVDSAVRARDLLYTFAPAVRAAAGTEEEFLE